MGRPPKPTTIAWLSGDPSKKRRYQIEPAPPAGDPPMPDWLDATGKAEWEFTVGVLREMNCLSRADAVTLAVYCDAVSRYVKAREVVARTGPVILSPNKSYPIISPYHSVMRAALKDILSFSDRFGLSPSARARLSIDAAAAAPGAKWIGLVG